MCNLHKQDCVNIPSTKVNSNISLVILLIFSFGSLAVLQLFDDIIFAFFSLEMSIKMVAMGVYGKNTYLADSWNRLDFFIVLSGALEYCLNMENLNLTAIRTIRVLRPLRAINRIPSKKPHFK